MKDFLKSLFHRSVLIPIAIIGLLGIFLALYYFVYTPKQQVFFNKRAFRVLAHISENLRDRIDNYSTAIVTTSIQKRYTQGEVINLNTTNISPLQISSLRQPVSGDVNEDSIYSNRKLLRNDSIIFSIQNNKFPNQKDTGKTLKEILDPIVSIRNNIFESVVLFTGEKKGVQTLLYKSGSLTMDREIIADSLIKHTDAFLFPTIKQLQIEGATYKLFLYSFRIDKERYVIGGFIPQQDYKAFSQYFPITYILMLSVIILMALLSLPFLKIFMIGQKENITLKDVRSVIAMLFVIPFLFILFLSAFWMLKTESNRSSSSLKILHAQVTQVFKNELATCLKQLIEYEDLFKKSDAEVMSDVQQKIAEGRNAVTPVPQMNLRDLFFYPSTYKNMDGVFWINDKGVEIEKWNYVNIISPYLYLSGRQYFKNIRSGTLDSLEGFPQVSKYPLPSGTGSVAPAGTGDSATRITNINNPSPAPLTTSTIKFSIQPTLSKATGNYTVNIVKPSDIRFISRDKSQEKQAVLVGISTKMYAVFKPVVPKGYNFCIVNSNGDILFHSESDRSLHENLIEETGNSTTLRTAITNRDSAWVNTILYDREVKVLVTPMQGLPYHLVTYYNKRIDYLFTFHVIAFSFLAESLLLLALSLFIMVFYFTTRKHSKLFFTPEGFDWIKPTPEKIPFYKTLISFQLILLAVILLALLVVSPEQRLNFIMQTSVIFPFSVATGYYMFRSAETIAGIRNKQKTETDKQLQELMKQREQNTNETEDGFIKSEIDKLNLRAATFTALPAWRNRYFLSYAKRIGKILAAYLCVLLVFVVFKDSMEERSNADPDQTISFLLPFLCFIIPVATIYAATQRFNALTSDTALPNATGKNYLNYLSSALLLSVLLISILPTTGFVLFSSHQETSLQTKAAQMDMAKKIQEHRLFVNDKVSNAKYHPSHEGLREEALQYARRLKFNKQFGLYLLNNDLVPITRMPLIADSLKFYNSVIYKRITDYLFLPADHFDFYNNTKDYFWTLEKERRRIDGVSTDELRLYYANLVDTKDRESLMLASNIPHNLPLIRRFDINDGLLFFSIITIFFLALYSLFISLTRRVFLIGYFQGPSSEEQDTSFVNSQLANQKLTDFERNYWRKGVLNLKVVQEKERECYNAGSDYAECVLKMQTILTPAYESIWKSLHMNEQSVIYDFALDGFTNYRNINILYSLYQKSIIRKEKHHLRIMTDSFRNFLVNKTGTAEIKLLQQTVSEGGKWGNLRAIFYIVLFAIVLFLFITREDLSKRVLTIATALAAIIPLLLKLFDPFSPSKGSEK